MGSSKVIDEAIVVDKTYSGASKFGMGFLILEARLVFFNLR